MQHLQFKLISALLLASCVLSATTATIQIQSLTGGFLAACTLDGCGGKLQGMENGTVDGAGNMTDGNNLYLYCVDFENDFYLPSPVYTANITPIVAGTDMSNTVYGRAQSAWAPGDPVIPTVFTHTSFTDSTGSFTPASALQRYQMAAWLINQYAAAGADRNAIEFAIWTALEVTPPAGVAAPVFPKVLGKTKTDMNVLLSDAADYVSGPDTGNIYSHFKIATEIAPIYLNGPNQMQEFMYINPEPAAMAILVAMVFGLLAFAKWRKPAQAPAR